jgi:phosphoribosylformylglycinamidine synthase
MRVAESTARAGVASADSALARVLEGAAAAGVPVARLGRTGGDALTVEGLFTVPLAELRSVHEATLPALFG